MILDAALLARLMVCPDGPLPAKYLAPMNEALLRAEINTPKRMAMFFAHGGHECNSLRWMEEFADGRAYDITVNPKLARMLGNDQPGDGPKHKGYGMYQLTGKDNHRAYGIYLGVGDLFLREPKQIATNPRYAILTSAFYWSTRKTLYPITDNDDGRTTEVIVRDKAGQRKVTVNAALAATTKIINGAYNGIEDRYRRWLADKKALGI